MKLVSHDEYKKRMWQKKSLAQKIYWKWLGVVLWFEDTAHALFGIGEHQTVGRVGGKRHFCMVCHKYVENPDYKEERKALKNAQRQPSRS